MAIALEPEVKEQALASIKRFLREELELDVGDLKAGTVLEYVLRELGPVVYNRAIQDAQRWFQERALDLDGVCHQEEFGYFGGRSRRR
jgi:uncharacterized protein (DUF2164 family)